MAQYFTPSPRLSKRRKVGTYGDGVDRTTLDVTSPPESANSELGIVADIHPENSTESVATKARIDEHERLNPGRATKWKRERHTYGKVDQRSSMEMQRYHRRVHPTR